MWPDVSDVSSERNVGLATPNDGLQFRFHLPLTAPLPAYASFLGFPFPLPITFILLYKYIILLLDNNHGSLCLLVFSLSLSLFHPVYQ